MRKGEGRLTLPVLTLPDDVQEVVSYLKNKPTGATIAEAKATLNPKRLDGRKLSGYQAWGFVEKDANRLRLTPRGWAMARSNNGATEQFREAVDSIGAYRAALEWAFFQNFESLTNVDVAAYWHEHHTAALGTANENTIKDNAVCFFHLCTAAGFGTLTIGRRGNPTRFSLSREAVKQHIEAGPARPQWQEGESDASLSGDVSNIVIDEPETTGDESTVIGNGQIQVSLLNVFISHGGNMEIVGQVETMLSLADIKSEVAEKEETTAIPVPQKVFDAMRRCQAGIITVTADEGKKDESGNYSLNENVLIEIGAAFVLYDKRVVLVWDRRLSVPSNLQGLYRCEFEGDELSWSAGMKLMKAIQGFKKQ
jgi:hypothetical protein